MFKPRVIVSCVARHLRRHTETVLDLDRESVADGDADLESDRVVVTVADTDLVTDHVDVGLREAGDCVCVDVTDFVALAE